MRIAAVPARGASLGGDSGPTRSLPRRGSADDRRRVDAPAAYRDVSVTVNYNFPVVVAGFIPGLDNATIPLSSTTTMRREY